MADFQDLRPGQTFRVSPPGDPRYAAWGIYTWTVVESEPSDTPGLWWIKASRPFELGTQMITQKVTMRPEVEVAE